MKLRNDRTIGGTRTKRGHGHYLRVGEHIAGSIGDNILLETGDDILLEDGGKITSEEEE